MSIAHWAIVAVIVFLLFGAGKLPRLMGDVADGIKAFKKGMKDDGNQKSKSIEDKKE